MTNLPFAKVNHNNTTYYIRRTYLDQLLKSGDIQRPTKLLEMSEYVVNDNTLIKCRTGTTEDIIDMLLGFMDPPQLIEQL